MPDVPDDGGELLEIVLPIVRIDRSSFEGITESE